MTYNHNRRQILRKVSFSHCHLHSRWRSTPGTGRTSLCNICDKSPWFYCSCSLFSQHSCDVFEKRYVQDLHWDVRPGDDVRFPGLWDQALVCVWSPIGWCSCLSPCWKVSRHSHRQDQEYCITQYSTEKAENVYKVTWSDESSGQHHRKLAQNVVQNRQRNLTRPYWTVLYQTTILCFLLKSIQSFLACNK